MTAKADLHVHSRHSNRPAEWFLRQIKAPESYTEPLEIYRRCRANGMSFVTISDHDTIDGALEIAHLPHTFLSCEVTVEFPEDGCLIHLLVFGISEGQHREIQRLRENIYQLRDYLVDQGIAHSVAHPFYRVNDRLSIEHVEKLLLLFKRFEARNGMHDRRANGLVDLVLGRLTPEILDDLADRHRIDPRDPEPWRKHVTGGSDDHGGIYIATTCTETPNAETADDFLRHIAEGRTATAGASGSALRLAQSLFSISHRYCSETIFRGFWSRRDPFAKLLRELAQPVGRISVASDTGSRRMATFRAPMSSRSTPQDSTIHSEALERETLARTHRICADLVKRCTQEVGRALRRGRLTESIGNLAHLAPAALAVAPYIASFKAHYKDEELAGSLLETFGPADGSERRPAKAWVTDTLRDINGVAQSIQTIGQHAVASGRSLTTIACNPHPKPGADPGPNAGRIHYFEPVTRFLLPGYEQISLAVPSFPDVLDTFETHRFGEVIISTPGPMGLAALLAAQMLGIKTTAIYHTDFPLYSRHLSGSALAEQLTWRYMRWFFGGVDRLYVPTRIYGELLARNGFERDRIRVMAHGVDCDRFHPRHRNTRFWQRWSDRQEFTFLYVGRISKEKNLNSLLEAFHRFLRTGRVARLVIVGDGPALAELSSRFAGDRVIFTGFLHGGDLSCAYASADLFVFPSTTDTYGNAVLEAHASGLGAIVTNQGGPQEIVAAHGSGLIVNPQVPGSLVTAMNRAFDSSFLRQRLRRDALKTARSMSWDVLLDRLWGDLPDDRLDPTTIEAPSAPSDSSRSFDLDPSHERLAG